MLEISKGWCIICPINGLCGYCDITSPGFRQPVCPSSGVNLQVLPALAPNGNIQSRLCLFYRIDFRTTVL
jgi:hypothetical protein